MKQCKKMLILLFICSLYLILLWQPLIAESTIEESNAEINAYIEKAGELPVIGTSSWTGINLTIQDTIGMNWTQFQRDFFNDSKPIMKLYFLITWSLLFNKQLPVPIQNYLGYTSLHIEVDTPSNHTNGWFTRITPNTITNTTTGKTHTVLLELKIDAAPVTNTITLRLNCSRYDTVGMYYGSSYIDIPLKANPEEFIAMKIDNSTIYSTPHEEVLLQAQLTNKGFYKETFFFILNSSEEVVTNMNDQVLVLESGETKTISFNVLTPDELIDLGTPYLISLSAYSSSNKIIYPIGSYTVIVRGAQVTHLLFLVVLPIILFLVVVFIFYSKILKKRSKIVKQRTMEQ